MTKHNSRHRTLQAVPFVMISQSFKCLCQTATVKSKNTLLVDFAFVRDKCAALREILVPNDIWKEFQDLDNKGRDNAQHRSMLILAFDRGHLVKFTSPVHRYLLDGEDPVDGLNPNYKTDLKEQWLIQKYNELERHRVSKRYMGKITELQCTEWLEDQGWKIVDLAALGGKVDITATAPGGKQCVIEVKYIGQDDEVFKTVVEALQGIGGAGWGDLYGASNYILLRAYDAAKQLEKSTIARIALIVISGDTWSFMQQVLEKDWINWDSPSFAEGTSRWKGFLDSLKTGKRKELYRNIENDLSYVLHTLDQIWICKVQEGIEYSIERLIWFGS